MTVAVEFPSPADYARAIQLPSRFDASLQGCRHRNGVLPGLPMSFTGSNAIVFPCDDDDGAWALRFFTNARAADATRYSALERFQARVGLPWPAHCNWLDRAVRIGDHWFPGVRMELVDGVHLDQYVMQLAGNADTISLGALAADWRNMVESLQAARFAHGDLQHGNVLVEESTGALRLVDFDGIWLDDLASDPPSERGHACYQHPGRLRAEHWGPGVDTFSGLLVYLSLRALAADPSLIRHAVIGNRLLVGEEELTARTASDGTVLADLLAAGDPVVVDLAGLLIEWLAGPPDRPERLAELLAGVDVGSPVTPSDRAATSEAARPDAAGGPPRREQQWWHGSTPVSARTEPHPNPEAGARVPATGPEPATDAPIPAPSPSSSSAPTRALPSREQIRTQVEADVEVEPATDRSSTWGVDHGASGPAESVTAAPSAGSGETHHGESAPSVAAGSPRNRGQEPQTIEVLGRRLLAAITDFALGLLLLNLVWLAAGETPGKRSGGLVVERTDGEVPGQGRLIVREIVLKQVPFDLAVLGVFIGIGPMVILSVGWMVLGAVLALGAEGRTLWDHLCDTRVRPAEWIGLEGPVDQIPEPAEAEPDTAEGAWWR
ncbi:MAG: hypothetical protein AAF547_05420 [Actinomycetota bacterium]